MVETVSDGGAAQLVTSAKAAVSQPTPSTEAFVSDCEQESFSEPSMLSPGSPLATVDSEPAAQQQDTAQSLSGKSSKARRDEQLKPCISSPSSRGGSEREREQPVVPKRGQRKPWRSDCPLVYSIYCIHICQSAMVSSHYASLNIPHLL